MLFTPGGPLFGLSRGALDAAGGGGTVTPGPEAAAFLARTTGLNATHTNAVAALINGLVADSLWGIFDYLYIIATQDATTAGLNLKSTSFTLTPVGSPTFTPDAGYTGQDLVTPTKYLNTGYLALTNAVNFLQHSGHASVWIHSDVTTVNGGIAMGLVSGDYVVQTVLVTPRGSDGKADGRLNFATSNLATTTATAAGHLLVSRTLVPNVNLYKNGSFLDSDVDVATAKVDNYVYILSLHASDGGPALGFGGIVSAASLGGPMDATQAANFYSRLRTYMTAVGVP